MAVVVTYHPDTIPLRGLLGTLYGQVQAITVIDNTPGRSAVAAGVVTELQQRWPNLWLHALGENVGIAAALNLGIRRAIEEGYGYVLLSDQDSLPSEGMVACLRSIAERLQAQGVRVGCVNPEYYDHNTDQAFPFQVQLPGRWFYCSAGGAQAKPWLEILTGITSGSLVPIPVFAEVGLMREDYFIDYVDTEWCHRARHHGYRLYGTSATRLQHHLGEDSFPVWMLGWRAYSAYSPQRLYYRFRNFVLILKLRYVSPRWKMRASWYWLGNAYAYTVFSPRRWQNLRMIMRGLWDGVRGRGGPLA